MNTNTIPTFAAWYEGKYGATLEADFVGKPTESVRDKLLALAQEYAQAITDSNKNRVVVCGCCRQNTVFFCEPYPVDEQMCDECHEVVAEMLANGEL